MNTYEWKTIHAGGEWLDFRRNHSAVIVGKYMMIHGGINNKNSYLNDYFNLDLTSLKWSKAVVE